MISAARLDQLLAEFPRLQIGLLGDLFLDRYLDIDPELSELSIETGLEAYQVTRVRNSPGALGTVLNNLASLGVGRLVPVTVLGDDGQAYDLGLELARLPVDARAVLRDASRQTPTYTKPMRRAADGSWQELNRLDLRNRAPLSLSTQHRLLAALDEVFATCDGLIVLDQVNEENWGVVNAAVREHLSVLARRFPQKLIFIDSRQHVAKFTVGVLKPNLDECLRALGRPATDDPLLAEAAATELSRARDQKLFCTLGSRGILVVRPGQAASLVPAVRVEGPIDIVGAGDSATAGIVASLLAGADETTAAILGNLAASITIQQLGTTGTASPGQLRDRRLLAEQQLH